MLYLHGQIYSTIYSQNGQIYGQIYGQIHSQIYSQIYETYERAKCWPMRDFSSYFTSLEFLGHKAS